MFPLNIGEFPLPRGRMSSPLKETRESVGGEGRADMQLHFSHTYPVREKVEGRERIEVEDKSWLDREIGCTRTRTHSL